MFYGINNRICIRIIDRGNYWIIPITIKNILSSIFSLNADIPHKKNKAMTPTNNNITKNANGYLIHPGTFLLGNNYVNWSY